MFTNTKIFIIFALFYTRIVTMHHKFLLFFVGVLFYTIGARAQTVIPLQRESDGKYQVDAKVNGVGVRTYYTEESWFASMSSTTYLFLYENGYIADADVKGMTVVKMPTGKTTKAGSFVIRSLRIGNVIVKNLPAFVIAKQSVPLLIGSSTFDCFGEVSIVDDKLYVNDAEEVVEATEVASISHSDSLRVAIQAHLDASEYVEAASDIEELMEEGPLSMYNEYQYIVVLNILGRSDETIGHAEKWLSEHAGKSLTCDYWMYDALGDSYAVKKDTAKAIECYERAVDTYCLMFKTTEKELRKSPSRDETLGVTLFDLSRLYATAGNHKKAIYYASFAAKCGNPGAKEFCDKFKIKY